ncbi:MAG: 2-hydroxyacyl-CoA dehydratase [Lachnospiraceae bacterium]|nr:2-hydroxyacyl-CoA dehydratase [Lachnospiraceae bacterium]
MLYYICKYTPIEAFSAMGVQIERLEPEVSSFPKADSFLHPNLCSYVKGAYELCSQKAEEDPDFEGVVFTTCCDSVKRLFDVLSRKYPNKFWFVLDLPRMGNEFAAKLYASRIRACLSAYEEFSGRTFEEEELSTLLNRNKEPDKAVVSEPGRLRIGVVGARISSHLRKLIEDAGAELLFDQTCTGDRLLLPPEGNRPLLEAYAYRLLNQLPCMRMAEAVNRDPMMLPLLQKADGIVYHTIKFCDNYSFEYADLKDRSPVPLLALETDGTTLSYGQQRTRIEAFLEELSPKKQKHNRKTTGDKKMYVIGIDSGSTSTNAVLINEKLEILDFRVIRTGAKSIESAEAVLKSVLKNAGLQRSDISRIISTGYGRVSIPFADKNITEITCHGKGAHFLFPEVRTILDIGGQDSKAIRLNEKGEVADFVMNDKCAAGTGRFLEAMARTLELSIEELGPVSLRSREVVEISSMCTVFAESEVISLIALNKEQADIAAGVHRAIANKAMTLLRKTGLIPSFCMTGGVAKNPGVIHALEQQLGEKLLIPEEPEIVGALGAALLGAEDLF